jgi:hypothetical protein
MEANQNFSSEFDLCSKTDITCLSSNTAKATTIKELMVLRTMLGTLESQRKITIDQRKVTCESTAIKIESQNNPKSSLTFYRTPDMFGKSQ